MSKKAILIALGLLFIFVGESFAQHGPLSLRAEVSGQVWCCWEGKVAINPQRLVYVDIYANYDPSGQTPPRITWSSPFSFTGTGDAVNVIWGDTAFFPQAQFRSFWDVFQMTYAESWDGTLPSLFNFTGIGDALGYPSGLGEILVLRLPAIIGSGCVGYRGDFCISQGDAVNDIYDWVFDDPQPSLPATCWQVFEVPCSPPHMDSCPSQLIASVGQEIIYDFDFSGYEHTPFIKLLSGSGNIDSVTGIWNFTPSLSMAWSVPSLMVKPYDHCSCTRDSCIVPLYISGVCGDANGDGVVNVRDVTACINCLYKITGCEPNPGMNSNGIGGTSVLDITYTIRYLYKNGPAPLCPPPPWLAP